MNTRTLFNGCPETSALCGLIAWSLSWAFVFTVIT
jgi:hypothetical protein